MLKKPYYSEITGYIPNLSVISYATWKRKKLRYIFYDAALGLNIYEEYGTLRIYALTDTDLFDGMKEEKYAC